VSAFVEATRIVPVSPGRFSVQAEAGWRQGAGLWGGIVFAWLTRALEAQVHGAERSVRSDGAERSVRGDDPERPLRSVTVDLCAPVKPRPAEVVARVVRAGRSASFCAAEVLQGGEVVATASAVFAARRSTDADLDRSRAPAVPPPEAVAPWPHGPPSSGGAVGDPQVAPRPGAALGDRQRLAGLGPTVDPLPGRLLRLPDFTRFLEHRQCVGPQPLSGGDDPRTGGWTRLLEPAPVDAALVLALLDAWPPALFGVLAGVRSAATVRATFDLLAPLDGLEPAAPLLVTAQSVVVRDGYSAEDEALWSPGGRLLAQGRQTVALL
jgi:acyl-coenzyme A thioesterase PaaI-like protein